MDQMRNDGAEDNGFHKKLFRMTVIKKITTILAFILLTILAVFILYIAGIWIYEDYIVKDPYNLNTIPNHIYGRQRGSFYKWTDVTDSIAHRDSSRLNKHKAMILDESLCYNGVIILKLVENLESFEFRRNGHTKLDSFKVHKPTDNFKYVLVDEQPVNLNTGKIPVGIYAQRDSICIIADKPYLVNYGVVENPEIKGSFKEFVIFTPTDGKEGIQFIADKWFENDEKLDGSTVNVSMDWTQDKQKLRIILRHSFDADIISEPLFLIFDGKTIKHIGNDQLSGEL